MDIKYEDFSSWKVPDKISFIEDWFSEEKNLENISEKKVKKFFREILENEQVGYIKVLAIETLIFLTTLKKIRRGSTLDILLDIDNEDDSFVIITTLRYLTMFLEEHEDILHKIDSLKGHDNPEVSSEAYFRLGLLNFLEANSYRNKAEFIDSLNKSISLFNYSRNQIENRTDAEYFYHVSKFLESFIIINEEQMNDSFNSLFKITLIRQAFHYSDNLLAIEYNINKVFLNLKYIYNSTKGHHAWVDFYKEFKQLAMYHFEILECSLSTNEFQKVLLSKMKFQISNNIVKNLYLKSFSYYETRINTLLNMFDTDGILVDFLVYLLEVIKIEDKKKDEIDIVEMCAKIDSIVKGHTRESKILDLVTKFKTTHDIESIDDTRSYRTIYRESAFKRFWLHYWF
ncbi:hypothetical protein [Bacillus sp. T33-2]|uniref:hypothetical protein n=1 Tax=Bacillus sp. T33-2 TaxID=2054168 RepID=UPI000C791F79|nr:hypothetical protein [Bacillus sp. T33-2]PLR99046.1 hypothetical protein CVD19_02980 [Bacillus sp. T33-2]